MINLKAIGWVVLLGMIIYLGVFDTGSTIEFRTYEDTERIGINEGTFDFDGYLGNYETTVLGQISCTGKPGSHYCYTGTRSIEETSFSNNLQDGETLILTSSAYSNEANINNYIKTNTTLPKGTLKVNLEYDLYSYQPYAGDMVVFKVLDKEYSYSTPMGTGKQHYNSGSESIEVRIEEETDVELTIETSGGGERKYKTDGILKAQFYPDETTEEPEDNIEEDTENIEDSENETTEDLSFIDKINLAIDNFFSAIFGWFK